MSLRACYREGTPEYAARLKKLAQNRRYNASYYGMRPHKPLVVDEQPKPAKGVRVVHHTVYLPVPGTIARSLLYRAVR